MVLILEKYALQKLKNGTKVQRFKSMDKNKDFITLSIFGGLIRSLPFQIGTWYQLVGVDVNNYLDWCGVTIRKDSSVKSLIELGMEVPNIEPPPQEKTVITGKIVHFDRLSTYAICAHTSKR